MLARTLLCLVVFAVAAGAGEGRATADEGALRVSWRNNRLLIDGPQVPNGPIEINYIEAFVRSGSTERDWGQSVINHRTECISAEPNADSLPLMLRSTLDDGVVVHHTITAGPDEVYFQLGALNPTKKDSDVQWAQPCVRVTRFTGNSDADANARQPKYIENCFLMVGGEVRRLPTEPWAEKARYTPGQVYCPVHVNRADVNPRPLSTVVPSCGLTGCYSADRKKILALGWEPYQEVFQGVVGCLHNDFRIGGLKAGEHKLVRGKIYLVDADLDKLKARFAKDFPKQATGVSPPAAAKGAAKPETNSKIGPVDAQGRPRIDRLGTIVTHMVETTPIVFKGKLYRFEWVRENDPKKPIRDPNNKLGYDHFRFIDVATGEATEPFAKDYRFGSAFVEGDTVYVTGSGREGGWYGKHVKVFASKDLKNWESWYAIEPGKYGICNTSIAKADGKYVLMFEIWLPVEEAGVKFTARFATSPDLKTWTITPPECVYAKDRYTAPHALRYLDGWYYNFYLEKLKEEGESRYETRVVRSRDLITWEASPLNPVLHFKPEEDKKIANEKLTQSEREQIAKARDINNSDIDFCEHNGKLVIYYTWGDQLGTEFLAEARYDGTEEQFLKAWWPQK